MGDWLQVYNVSDVGLFIEVVRKTTQQNCLGNIDVCYDTDSITVILVTYVLNKL